MLVHENDKLIDVLIYDINGDTATCLNSLAYLDQKIFRSFANHLFDSFPSIKKIEYPSSYNNYTLNKSVLTLRSDDYVISLPLTTDEYFQNLGSSTRSNIRKHKNKFLRDYPQANFITKIGSEIEKGIVDKIIQLNFERIKSKGEIPHSNHTHTNDFYKYSQYYGCVSYIEIDGLIVAGSIAFVLNKSIYSYFIAHDNNFSKYNAGQLGLIYLIQTSIEKGLSELHLLWGETDYKTRFLAKPRPMYSYIVYKTLSRHFITSKIKEMFSLVLYQFKRSKLAKPLKRVLKKFQKKSFQELSKLEYMFLIFSNSYLLFCL